MSLTGQVITYIISPLATLLAVWIAYLAVLRGAQPQILIYYQPNPDTPSLIDLVLENVGGGNAFNITFSKPLPINCFGIEKSGGEGLAVPKTGLPMIAPKQRYVFNGGQYAGLDDALGGSLMVKASYKYQNPIGFSRKASSSFVLGIRHLAGIPTKTSPSQAIVEALKGPNTTTIQEICNELRKINKHLGLISNSLDEKINENNNPPTS